MLPHALLGNIALMGRRRVFFVLQAICKICRVKPLAWPAQEVGLKVILVLLVATNVREVFIAVLRRPFVFNVRLVPSVTHKLVNASRVRRVFMRQRQVQPAVFLVRKGPLAAPVMVLVAIARQVPPAFLKVARVSLVLKELKAMAFHACNAMREDIVVRAQQIVWLAPWVPSAQQANRCVHPARLVLLATMKNLLSAKNVPKEPIAAPALAPVLCAP